MSDLLFQNISEPQSKQQNQPGPVSIPAATTVAPVNKFTIITGTTQIGTITPPVTGVHMLYLLFTDGSPGTTLTTGNILTAVVPTVNIPCQFLYDPNQAKYYGWANNLT
jgi:hypothetical protein